jgi:hypothetical protein
MKETEVDLTDEGFEEITGEEKKDSKPGTGNSEPETGNWKPGTGNRSPATGNPQDSGPGTATGGNRPDFRVVQTDRDKDGKSVYINVGGMWKNVSKSGNEFYTLKIGQLKLLVFANDKK